MNASCTACSRSPVATPSIVVIARALGLQQRDEAAVDEAAVEQHGAGAALAFAAALFGAGETQIVAQHVEQPRHRMPARRVRPLPLTRHVNGDRRIRHAPSP